MNMVFFDTEIDLKKAFSLYKKYADLDDYIIVCIKCMLFIYVNMKNLMFL